MYSVYLDEVLLEAAGLLEFPEYYAYIIERYQEPVPPAQRIPIGEQILQKQVQDNDDILFSTNEEFVPPVSNALIKLDLSSQQERSSFLASRGSDPQLIVYGVDLSAFNNKSASSSPFVQETPLSALLFKRLFVSPLIYESI
ncbi:MAG: hypothetical protein EZS28_055701, partial [Streblomastix strix]